MFALSAFAIVINQVISSQVESLTGLSLVLIGLPVYYLWARDPSRASTSATATATANDAAAKNRDDARSGRIANEPPSISDRE